MIALKKHYQGKIKIAFCPLCAEHWASKECPNCPWELFGYESNSEYYACCQWAYEQGASITALRLDPTYYPEAAKKRVRMLTQWIRNSVVEESP
jgi:hypothetical protein